MWQLCGQCRRVSYCCRDHQTLHWRDGHKQECKRLQHETGNGGCSRWLLCYYSIIVGCSADIGSCLPVVVATHGSCSAIIPLLLAAHGGCSTDISSCLPLMVATHGSYSIIGGCSAIIGSCLPLVVAARSCCSAAGGVCSR